MKRAFCASLNMTASLSPEDSVSPSQQTYPLQYGLHNFMHRSVQSVQVAFLNEVNRSNGRCAIPRNRKIGKQLLSEYVQDNSGLRIYEQVFTFALQNSMGQSSCRECRRRSPIAAVLFLPLEKLDASVSRLQEIINGPTGFSPQFSCLPSANKIRPAFPYLLLENPSV